MFKIIKNSLITLTLINLVACSYSPDALKDLYNEIPDEISEDIKKPIEATDQQSKMIDNYATELMQWHRRNKLPEYSQNITQFANLIRQENAPLPAIKSVLSKMNDLPHFNQAHHLTHKMSAVARSLSPQQITRLEQHLNNEYQKDLLDIKTEKHASEITEFLKTAFQIIDVDLNQFQQSLIKAESLKFHDIRQVELQAENIWNKQLIALLKQKNNPNFTAQFAHLWNEQDAKLTGKAAQLEQQNDHLMASLVKKLADSFEQEQRENLYQMLISVANTFNEMANE